MTRVQLCLFALAALCCTLARATVPSYLKVCGRRDPNLSECVKQSAIGLLPKLSVGIPELDVPSLEPLTVDRIPLAELPDFKAVATNVELRGLSKFQIKYLKVDLDKNRIDLEMMIPEVFMKSDYDVKAKILVPINEKGPIDIKTGKIEAKAMMKFKHVEHRGRKLIYFPTMTCKMYLNEYTATFRPGANDNPIAQAINDILVSSQKEIIESMTPNIEKAISSKVLELSNRIVRHFTYDELFPDRV